MREHEALVAEARGQAKCYSEGGLRALIRSLAGALETATVERAVVEAQALEQAAGDMYRQAGDMYGQAVVLGGAPGWLRARAVEIREGRQ